MRGQIGEWTCLQPKIRPNGCQRCRRPGWALHHTSPPRSFTPMPTEPCAAIWDVDGTLVDTAGLHFAAWERMSREMGRPFTREDFAATFGRRNPEIIRFLFRREFTDAEVLDIGERKENYYRAAAEAGVQLLPGVRELLDGLHARGVRQAVGSSAPRGNLDLILRITGSRQYFDAIVGMEDTHRGKPDPEVFLVA